MDGRWQWRGLGRKELLKIYLSHYALLRANIKISLNSLSIQQLRNTLGFGEESREPSTGKASFQDSEIGTFRRGQFFLISFKCVW